MLKLMKYEFRKTWFMKAILLAITAVAEIGFLIGLYAEQEDVLLSSILVLLLLALGGLVIIGVGSVMTLHRDMTTKQSYMLFMTPNSCYSILGAKMLECGLSVLLTGVFFFALGALDISLLLAKQGELGNAWKLVQEVLSSFSINGRPIEITLGTMAALTCSLLSGWILTIATAYLADVISVAMLNGKKFSGLVSFLLFLLLSILCARLVSWITGGIASTVLMLWVDGLVSLALSGIMVFATAKLMEEKLSV